MKKILVAACFLSSLGSFAQLTMINDHNPALGYGAFGYLTPFGSNLVFFGDNGSTGNELYKYDGNAISLLYDMQVGTASSAISAITNAPLPVINGVMYLYADSISPASRKIKKYNGTSAPVYINSGTINYSGVTFMIAFNNKLYFTAKTATEGTELFVYDPVTDNMKLVKDIYAGSGSSNPGYLTVFNNKVYFTAATATTNHELFAYDPVADTAGMVIDLNPGMPAGNVGVLHVYNGKMYFSASDGTHGKELYEYDGTGAPRRLTDINLGTGHGVNNDIGYYKGALYFSGQDASSKYQLYKYDLATSTPSLAQTLAPGKDANPAVFFEYANKLFFRAGNGTDGTELWMYDGNSPASMIADINSGAGGSSHPESFAIYKNDLYFVATDFTQGRELFKWHENIPAGGITAASFAGAVNVYPNPATQDVSLHISLPQASILQITLTDVQGKIVYTIPATQYAVATHHITLPIQSLGPGNYFYRVCDGMGKLLTSGKLVKE